MFLQEYIVVSIYEELFGMKELQCLPKMPQCITFETCVIDTPSLHFEHQCFNDKIQHLKLYYLICLFSDLRHKN